MRVHGRHYRSIWCEPDGFSVGFIDQTVLPHAFATCRIASSTEAAEAIRAMRVRGAPLIGAMAAYGVALALRDDPSDAGLQDACRKLLATRPTAVNLRWALDEVRRAVVSLPAPERVRAAYACAAAIADADVATCRAIGEHGLAILKEVARKKPGEAVVNVLTHCNAGWLATVDYGTALAPVYLAHDAGIRVHVWVDETRPRNQGASLTAWELGQHGVAHTVIADNCGGHLMQNGLVDLCVVGTDRTTAIGDVCNKIGTYLKALAAFDNHIPFYAAVPSSSIDWSLERGVGVIPIEERDAKEVHEVWGKAADGRVTAVRVTPEGSRARNDAFDVTPARLVTGLITERGVCEASRAGLLRLFPERAERGGERPERAL